jgi:hypothetical protein
MYLYRIYIMNISSNVICTPNSVNKLNLLTNTFMPCLVILPHQTLDIFTHQKKGLANCSLLLWVSLEIANVNYVKSWRMTLAGLNGISTASCWLFSQFKIFSTSFSVIWNSSQFLIVDSNRIRIEYGSLSEKNKEKYVSCHICHICHICHMWCWNINEHQCITRDKIEKHSKEGCWARRRLFVDYQFQEKF